jgi:ubiquinone biosynthesis accessory factor UbiJ
MLPLEILLPRLVLLANHVLSQEPHAMAKLQPHAGKCLQLHLPAPTLPLLNGWLGQPKPVRLTVTPAGLLELTPAAVEPNLEVTLAWPDAGQAWAMLRKRQRPDMHITGDAQLAEVISWLAQNVRWDVAADLQHWFGMPLTASLGAVRDHLKNTAGRWQAGRSQNKR